MAKILIIKLGALGDVVMATALIRQIQQHHAQDELWLLTSPAYTEIFSGWPGLQVASFERKGLGASLRAVAWIRNKGFTRVYDLQSNDRSGILCALSGIPERIGNHPRFPYHLHPADKYTGQCHIHERMLEVLRAAGIAARYATPELPASEADRSFVASWLRQNNLENRRLVIMHPGASPAHPEKCWPYFPELARALADRDYTVIWSGADHERNIIRQFAGRAGIDACGVFSITGLAELGRHARFALTNDSGPMHVLSCSGIPVFAFFGPTDWRRNHAVGQAENVISAAVSSAEKFRPAALGNITPARVLQRLRERNLL